MSDIHEITDIAPDLLDDFTDHPFKPYEGERFNDMVESIRANGVLVPIIIRPRNTGRYEILSGHNRVRAARAAGLETVPAIVRESPNDKEALLIVTETNLIQRSFADMAHSERALVLATHYGAVKGRGYRSDLVKEIETMTDELFPYGAVPKSLRNLEKGYGLSKNTIARYLRINMLIPKLKQRLDDKLLTIRAAVELSYLTKEAQEIVADVSESNIYQLNVKSAELLRALSAERVLTKSDVMKTLYAGNNADDADKDAVPRRTRTFRITSDILSRYFDDDTPRAEIEKVLAQALENFYENE
jgi:ParB family chromosome partitioning protein